ncbi:uncharacterized protein KY384_004514 [Bacidia gigantensis]|uniref:uncharacterized protein n=1 Tax=Bacidia gigantensis TaxID=2732470 RepID=UPI001D05B588|nr:uncharacterized protein KY384_004514 [Bacidia gigantensis]KAG8531156.1 hypothetical protein KY384_004514 [Bacidia gigantensis]
MTSLPTQPSSPPPAYSPPANGPSNPAQHEKHPLSPYSLQISALDTGLNLEITSTDSSQGTYTTENSIRSFPSLTFYFQDANSEARKQLATVQLRPLSSNIHCKVGQQELMLSSRGFFKSGYRFTSPALNRVLIWKPEKKASSSCNWLLTDENGIPIARYMTGQISSLESGKPRSMDTTGLLEFLGEFGNPVRRLVDEVVVMGCAAVEQRRRKNARAAAGGGVGISAAGAAGSGGAG